MAAHLSSGKSSLPTATRLAAILLVVAVAAGFLTSRLLSRLEASVLECPEVSGGRPVKDFDPAGSRRRGSGSARPLILSWVSDDPTPHHARDTHESTALDSASRRIPRSRFSCRRGQVRRGRCAHSFRCALPRGGPSGRFPLFPPPNPASLRPLRRRRARIACRGTAFPGHRGSRATRTMGGVAGRGDGR